jgi:hypothetical protein
MGASLVTIPKGPGANIIMCQRKWIKTLDQTAKGKRNEGARIVNMETACASFFQTLIVATLNQKFRSSLHGFHMLLQKTSTFFKLMLDVFCYNF